MPFFYGVVNQRSLIETSRAVCDVLTPNNADDACSLLVGTCCAETAMGTTRDRMWSQGRGVTQIDSIRYGDIKKYILAKPELSEKIKDSFGFDMQLISYGAEIDLSPMLALILTRVGYYMRPEPIPPRDDIDAQAWYWKKHWNSSAGAGTVAHYKNSVETILGVF